MFYMHTIFILIFEILGWNITWKCFYSVLHVIIKRITHLFVAWWQTEENQTKPGSVSVYQWDDPGFNINASISV